MRRLLPLALALAAITPQLPAADRDADDKALRDLSEQFFAVYASKDLDAFMALWSEKSPDYAARKKIMTGLYAETGPIEVKSLTVVRVRRDGDAASVRVRVELTGNDLKTGKLHSSLGRLDRVLDLAREGGDWKIRRYGPAEQALMEQLAAAKDKDARQKLYDENKDLLKRQLVGTINVACLKAAEARRFDEATSLNELAFEVLDLCSDKSILPYCHLSRAYIAFQRPRYREALAEYAKALALAREMKERLAEAVALKWSGDAYNGLDEYDDALRSYEDSLPIYRELEIRSEEAAVLNNMGNVYQATARDAEALKRYQAALKIVRELGNRKVEGTALLNIGSVHYRRGEYPEALTHYEAALKISRQVKDREGENSALNNIGNVYLDTEKYEAALGCFESSLKIARELLDRPAESNALTGIGIVFHNTGRVVEAVDQFTAALKIDRELHLRSGEAIAQVNLGEAYNTLRRYPEAMPHFEAALKLSEELQDRKVQTVARKGLGGLYVEMAQFEEASRQCEAALKIARESGDRRTEADIRLSIGFIHERLGRNAEALAQYEVARKIAQELGRRAPQASAQRSVGDVYYHTGRFADALDEYEGALKIERELGDHWEEAHLINRIGLVHERTGRYDEAIVQFNKALKIVRELGDRVEEAETLVNIGGVYFATGRYPDALGQFDAALKIGRELSIRFLEARALGETSLVFQATGRFPEALQNDENGLKIWRELKDSLNEERTLGEIGNIYESMGRYADALEQHNAALKIGRAIGDRRGEAGDLNGLGTVYSSAGLYAESLRCHEDCLKIAQETDDRAGAAHSLHNLGVAYWNLGQRDKAIAMLNESLPIYRKLADRFGEAITLHNLGSFHADRDHYAEALKNYQASLKIRQELNDQQGVASTRGGMGWTYLKMHRFSDALRENEAALRIAEEIGAPETTLECYVNIGSIHWEEDRWDRAADSFRQGIQLVEQIRGRARERSLQTSFLAQHTGPYQGLAWSLVYLGRIDEAFTVDEQAKARALVDVLRTRAGAAAGAQERMTVDIRKGMTAEQRSQEQQLQERLTALAVQLEDLHSRKVDPKRQGELARALDRARQDYEAFRRELFLHLPDLQARRGEFKPDSLATLGRELFTGRSGLVVLSYLVGEKETLLFVLTAPEKEADAARLTVYRLDVGTKELAEAAAAFREACSDPQKGEPDADDLYRWLITPAVTELAGAKQVVVVPDGVLHTLPFQALRDPDGKYLIERFAVSYAPSATALTKMEELGVQRRKEYAGRPASLLAVGVSDFGRRERPLPAAEKEARAVAASFGDGAKLLPGAEATLAKLEASWSGRRYLHFATHGRLNPDAPLYSSLVLSPGRDGDEGVLYARDLVDAEIPAELAVMSACQTGLGRNVSGEGLLGLSWSWFAAGVPSTVASQWSVGDVSTAQLMKVFYARLKAGDSKAEALRQAELSLLKDDATRHPFYWAPFVLVGDDR